MSLAKQSAVAGAPGVLVIPGSDGTPHTFLVNKPSSTDLILMRKWVLAQPLPGQDQTRGLESSELAGLKPEQQALLLREYARSKSTRREPSEGEALELVFSPAGATMQVWLAARRQHLGLKKEDVAVLITDDNFDVVMADLDKAVGAEEEPGDPKALAGSTSSNSS